MCEINGGHRPTSLELPRWLNAARIYRNQSPFECLKQSFVLPVLPRRTSYLLSAYLMAMKYPTPTGIAWFSSSMILYLPGKAALIPREIGTREDVVSISRACIWLGRRRLSCWPLVNMYGSWGRRWSTAWYVELQFKQICPVRLLRPSIYEGCHRRNMPVLSAGRRHRFIARVI